MSPLCNCDLAVLDRHHFDYVAELQRCWKLLAGVSRRGIYLSRDEVLLRKTLPVCNEMRPRDLGIQRVTYPDGAAKRVGLQTKPPRTLISLSHMTVKSAAPFAANCFRFRLMRLRIKWTY